MVRRIWTTVRRSELARYGSLLFLALTLANLSNYLFHVVVSRMLGPEEYGALGALLSAFVLISVPAGALQIAVAKRFSILRAKEDEAEAGRLLRSLLRAGVLAAAYSGILVAAWSGGVARFLRLDSVVPALLLACYVAPAVLGPVARGALQGRLRFAPLAAASAAGTLLRLVAGVGFVALGWGVSGAVLASVVAEVAGVGLAVIPLGGLLRSAAPGRARLFEVVREARRAVLAGAGFWAVVSIDTILVRHYLPGEVSGFYAAAAVAAHAVLFFPGAIGLVAFPRFAESEGRSVEARRVLFQAVLAVGALGLGAAGMLALLRSVVVRTLFGGEYLAGTGVLGILALAMAMLGVVNVLVSFHLASGSRALWSLGAAAAVETAGIVAFHGSILEVSLVVAGVSAELLAFNLVAVYAFPTEPEMLPGPARVSAELALEGVDLSVVTPSYNPGPAFLRNLERLLDVLEGSGLSYEVIAVSDGSTDGSPRLLERLAEDRMRFIHYPENRGKGFALRAGLAHARGRYAAFIDSDGDLDPREIRSFVTLMRTYEVDLVVGSKRHSLSEVHYPPVRRLMSWTYHVIVRALFGVRVRDTQTGLKLARREVLEQVLPRLLEKRFAFDLELLVVAKRLGFGRFFEAPVRLDYKFSSTVSWRSVLGTLLDTLAIFYRCHILRYYDRLPGMAPATGELASGTSPAAGIVTIDLAGAAIIDGAEPTPAAGAVTAP